MVVNMVKREDKDKLEKNIFDNSFDGQKNNKKGDKYSIIIMNSIN